MDCGRGIGGSERDAVDVSSMDCEWTREQVLGVMLCACDLVAMG